MELLCIIGKAKEWFQSHLFREKQCTEILISSIRCNSFDSEQADIAASVPQHSILNPVLFSMYINSLCLTPAGSIIMHANGTSFICSGKIISHRNKIQIKKIKIGTSHFTK